MLPSRRTQSANHRLVREWSQPDQGVGRDGAGPAQYASLVASKGCEALGLLTNAVGHVHQLDNLFVVDGSVFPSVGAHNPTLTIMVTALRNARRWA